MYPLTLVTARPIGLMTMMDQDELDYKIIAVGVHDPEYNTYHDVHETAAASSRSSSAASLRTTRRWRTSAWWWMTCSPALEAVPVIEKALAVYRDWAKTGK